MLSLPRPLKDRLCVDGTMVDIDNVCSLSVSLFLSVNRDGTDIIHVSVEIDFGFFIGHQNISAKFTVKKKYIVCTRQYLVLQSID